jgi:hypothetical protein
MVKGRTMLQVQGTFNTAPNVKSEVLSSLHAYIWLQGARNRVTVREVSTQQAYFTGFSGPAKSGVGAIATGASAVGTLTLVVHTSRKPETIQALLEDKLTFGSRYYFHAPSYRDSPEVEDVDLALFSVIMPSWSVVKAWKLQSAKKMSGHCYFDENAVPLPPVKMGDPPAKATDQIDPKKSKITKTSEAQKTSGKVSQQIMIDCGMGELAIGLSDAEGYMLGEIHLTASGDPDARSVVVVPPSLLTTGGQVNHIPSILYRSDHTQAIWFDGMEPGEYISARSAELGCTRKVAGRIEKGRLKHRDITDGGFSDTSI